MQMRTCTSISQCLHRLPAFAFASSNRKKAALLYAQCPTGWLTNYKYNMKLRYSTFLLFLMLIDQVCLSVCRSVCLSVCLSDCLQSELALCSTDSASLQRRFSWPTEEVVLSYIWPLRAISEAECSAFGKCMCIGNLTITATDRRQAVAAELVAAKSAATVLGRQARQADSTSLFLPQFKWVDRKLAQRQHSTGEQAVAVVSGVIISSTEQICPFAVYHHHHHQHQLS
mgnify:CR=1 FL=1